MILTPVGMKHTEEPYMATPNRAVQALALYSLYR